ncbi:cysteine proteinase, partial [Ramicandelaber brevisporus]
IGLIGLHNYANTCYMNSIIQCLNATAPLRNLMRSGKYVKYLNRKNIMGSNGVIAVEFANLLNMMWKPDESFITPNTFRSAVRKHTEDRFAGDDQQDAQEFLTYLLNTLHEDLNTSEFCKSGVSQMDLTDEMTMKLEQKAVAVRSKYEFNRSLYRDKSKIADIFSGQQSSKLKCSVCGFTSTTYNLFDLLSVPIPDSSHKGAVPLQKCLEEYFKAETLSGNDAWECRKCKVKRTSTKKLILTRLPNVLTIHLKRFKGNGILNEKLRTFVDFPITGLDMSQFIHPGVAGTDENKVSKYNLFAVSNHYGNLDGGHYYSFVKAPLSEQWFVLEDRNVKTLATQDICIDQAYVLFYVRDQL